MEQCQVCLSPGPFERYRLREMMYGTREVFDYSLCPACGVLQIEAIPADLAPYYPASYYTGGGEPPPLEAFGGLAGRADRARRRYQLFGDGRLAARALRHWLPKSSVDARKNVSFVRRAGLRSFSDPIVDVGCGRVPARLLNLKRLGFDNLLGVDPFLEGDSDYRGIPLKQRTIHETTGSFQLVTLNHSFEHVPDPHEVMASARRLLRPGGVLMIRTPVMGTWFWKTFGTDWWELDAPRHLYLHTPDSLTRLGRAAGLELFDTVWDSTFLEIIASEQIRRDLAWLEPGSWGVDPATATGTYDLPTLKATVADLNRTGTAGRAGFYFRIAGSS